MRPLAVLGLLAVASLVSPTAGAQPVRACPPGQAVQALDPGGKVATCIPVPAPVDLGAVNAAISAEAAARTAGDQNLNGRVDAEAVARMEADQALRDSINEKTLVGTYSFFGTRTCVSNAASFDANGAPLPPQAPFNNWSMSRGFYTFNAGGTGNASADVITIGTGGASFTPVSGPISWSIEAGKLVVQGDFSNDNLHTENPAQLTGVLGKDLKVIGIGQEGLHVETLVQLRLINGVLTEVRTPRICNRQSTLIKMAD